MLKGAGAPPFVRLIAKCQAYDGGVGRYVFAAKPPGKIFGSGGRIPVDFEIN
jgi:hypothetical protein